MSKRKRFLIFSISVLAFTLVGTLGLAQKHRQQSGKSFKHGGGYYGRGGNGGVIIALPPYGSAWNPGGLGWGSVAPPDVLFTPMDPYVMYFPAPPSFYAYNGYVYGSRERYWDGTCPAPVPNFMQPGDLRRESYYQNPSPAGSSLPQAPQVLPAPSIPSAVEELPPPLESSSPALGNSSWTEPVIVEAAPRPLSPEEMATFFRDEAKEAFYNGDYAGARKSIRGAIEAQPQDGFAFLFLSQAHLANGEYTDAANALNSGLALLPNEAWGSFVERYDTYYGLNDYVGHMQGLNDEISRQSGRGDLLALRAYHFMYLGHAEAARDDLTAALQHPHVGDLAHKLALQSGLMRTPLPIEKPLPVSR